MIHAEAPTKLSVKMLAFALTAALAAPFVSSQSEKTPPSFGITFSGYVKTNVFYDSRQTVNIREGHYLLYPKESLLDPLGRDVNAKSNLT